MDIYVYKIDNHLVVKGPGIKYIKKELKSYNGVYQSDPFNIWLIPNTKKKSFIKNINILSKVVIKNIDKTLNDNDNLSILPGDMIKGIIYYINDVDITSILSVTKKLSTLNKLYRKQINKQALKRELKHVNENTRKYYSSKIYDIKVNDRVIIDNKNYKVIEVNKNKGIVEHVDLLGHSIGDKYHIQVTKNLNRRENSNSFYWAYKNKYLNPGILLFDNGPNIYSVDSDYLKYKVVPKNENTLPEENMIVLIHIDKTINGIGNIYHEEYVIKKLDNNEMILNYLGENRTLQYNNEELIDSLQVIFRDNKWMITNADNYSVYKIGGYGYKFRYLK